MARPSGVFEITGVPLVGQGPIITLFAKEVFRLAGSEDRVRALPLRCV